MVQCYCLSDVEQIVFFFFVSFQTELSRSAHIDRYAQAHTHMHISRRVCGREKIEINLVKIESRSRATDCDATVRQLKANDRFVIVVVVCMRTLACGVRAHGRHIATCRRAFVSLTTIVHQQFSGVDNTMQRRKRMPNRRTN